MVIEPRPPRPTSRRASRWTTAVAIGCTLVGVAALVVAWQQPGFPEVPPQPVDTSVWVMNESRLLVGRVNTAIGELDSAAPVRGVSDVLQDPEQPSSGAVMVVDPVKHELQVLDTATVTFGARVSIPDDAAVQLRGGTLAVADRADGRLWVGITTTIGSVDARTIDPTATLGPLPVLTVSTGGTVFATAAGSDTLTTQSPGSAPSSTALPDGPLSLGGRTGADGGRAGGQGTGSSPGLGAETAGAGDIQLTAVGETPVLLDRADSSIRVNGRRFALSGMDQAVLQQPGPVAAEVLIATPDGLLGVALADGAVRTVSTATGTPVPPSVSGGCVFGAWIPAEGAAAGGSVSGAAGSTTGRSAVSAVAACANAPASPIELDGARAISPTFRRHGAAVVLGDGATGRSWIATDGFRPVDNWSDVAPPDSAVNDATTVDDPTTNADLPRLPPDCTAVPIGQPRAVDDAFGVRAGRATVLRVLDNDPSVDCTSVVIDSVAPLPSGLGTVAIVAGGSAVQVTLPPTAAGLLPPIDYQVGNGIGGTATARLQIRVVPPEVGAEPQRIRRSAATTEVNGTVSYNVLDDFVSPTGDDLFLVSANADSTDAVSFRPDGTVTCKNTGLGAGTDSQVEFVVSDGTQQTAGTLTVAIAPERSTTPVVYPLFTTAVVGSVAVANPLRSVISASADPVTISTVQPEPGSEAAAATLDPRDASVSITAPGPGTFYFTFEASRSGHAVTGVLRADFVAPTDASRAVVPMVDVAYLAPGGQTVLDPLANDTDPDGQGLAVREADLPAGAPITAAVADLHLVRVTAPRPVATTVVFGYTVFDGAITATGQIRIVPVPAPRRIPPPLATPITTTVRAGDAVTIPVDKYARSQDGSKVTAELDAAQVAGLPGRAFSTGDAIRYLAPADSPAGPVTFSYTAVAGSSTPLEPVQAVSTVTISVTAADAGRNSAPATPNPVTARVFAGGASTVSVPLAGVDPDGDWVVLQSIEQPEAPLGNIAIDGPNTLSYQAFGAPGVDRIRYTAADPAGATSTGEITVLVVAPSESARPPVAPDLTVSVRPGGSIRIDPLSEVVDPGGQRVVLASPAFSGVVGVDVQVDDQGLIVTAPAEPTVASLRYAVVNAKGLTASGSVKITVAADAPLLSPVAKDVFVTPADLAANNQTVDVDVSGSIVNRSGRRGDLQVSLDPLSAGQATMTGAQTIRVTLARVRQIVAYRVVDGYGASAIAFVVVPPQQRLVGPQVIDGSGPIQLDAGQSVDVLISDYVTVGGGRAPTIAPSPAPEATQGTAVRTSSTTLTLSAPSSAGGQAAVYVPIDDGTGAVVVLSLPVQIRPRLVPAPKLDSTELQIEAGTTASVDLAALTTTFDDLQAASITYEAGAGANGVQTVRDAAVVSVTAGPDTPRGTVVAVPIRVIDGDGRDGKGVLTVTVTGSRKPLATVVDQQVDQGRAGIEVAADLLTGSFDPIGLGLTVGDLTVAEGAGGIAAGPTLTGSTVRLTPAAGYVGPIVVAARVTDGTRDPERVVTATLRVSIQDKPSAPGVPTVVDGTLTAGGVQLAWTPADANGAPVEGYTVTAGGVRQDCPGTDSACQISGLVTGAQYVFVVTARNAVGESPPSGPSAVIVPDAVPGVPAAPLAGYVARGQLAVSWTIPTGAFSPVDAMSVQILRNDAELEVRDGVTSPLAIGDLDPSAAYRFQVRASNQAGTGQWSDPSAAVVPSGVPGAPTVLTAQFVFDTGRRGAQVSWGPPADSGGEPVLGYRLLRNDIEIGSGGPDFVSSFVDVGDDPVVFSVIARNARGDGPAASGASVAPFRRPSAVPGLGVAASDSALTATWSPAPSVGRPIDHYDYRIDGGDWTFAGGGPSTAIAPLRNGRTYQVQVRACTGETGHPEEVRCGPPGDAVPGTPFGALAPPVVDARTVSPWAGSVTANWSFPNGNGRPVTARTVRVTGDVTADLDPAAGSWTREVGFGNTVTITVRYCVAAPDECTAEVPVKVNTPMPHPLATVALPPLAGVCGVAVRYEGEWRTQAECPAADWVLAPASIDVLCRATGPGYPQVPAGNPLPPVPDWYFAADQKWYRAAAVAVPGRDTIPSCE